MAQLSQKIGRWMTLSVGMLFIVMCLWVRSYFVNESFYQTSFDAGAQRLSGTGVGWYDGRLTLYYCQMFPGRHPASPR